MQGKKVLNDKNFWPSGPKCSDPDPIVRAGAAFGLGDAGERAGPGAIEALAALKDDPDEDVREAAAFALSQK